jgi:hypothetical protein
VDARTPIYSWVELAQAFAHGSGRAELCRPVLQRILSSASASDGAIYAVDPSDASLSQVVATGILEASHRSRSRAVMRVTDAARESRCALHLSRAQLDELDLADTTWPSSSSSERARNPSRGCASSASKPSWVC